MHKYFWLNQCIEEAEACSLVTKKGIRLFKRQVQVTRRCRVNELWSVEVPQKWLHFISIGVRVKIYSGLGITRYLIDR